MIKTLTIVLPAHNEGESILHTLMELDSVAMRMSDYELIVYVSEDGSRDNTREKVLEASTKVRNCTIKLSSLSNRLGYSKGVLRGINECKTELVGFMDSDGQCDPNFLPSLCERLVPGVVVVGYRSPRRDSVLRKIYSKLFNVVYRIYGGPKRKDPSSPFLVAYRKDLDFLTGIIPKLSFGFWWEFQLRLKFTKVKVFEIPIEHRLRSFGETQVYGFRRLPKIIISHLWGLHILKNEIRHSKSLDD